jgi:dephospho-CoA kinase
MEVYGLTGGIGSGKSTVAAMLEEYGVPVVSADELSRMVVAPGSEGLADVVEAFGAEVLDERGELDRKKMGKIVFANAEKRRALEAILHPRIRERYEQVLDALEKAGHPVMVYEVPLLFEKKLHLQDEMKAVILVVSSADTRIARVKDRDALTTEEVLARMRTQMPEEEKRRLADYIVVNDGNLDDLRREVEYLISRYLRLPSREERSGSEVDMLDVLPSDGAGHDERPGELELHPPARLGATPSAAAGPTSGAIPIRSSQRAPTASNDTFRGPAPKPTEEVEELDELDAVEEVDELDEDADSLQVDLHDAAPSAASRPAEDARRPTVSMYARPAPATSTDEPEEPPA